MKTLVTLKQNIIKVALIVSMTAITVSAHARTGNEGTEPASVSLASFTAAINNNKADLKWETANEVNISHFVIERSTDGVNYSDAAVMFAYGSATDKANYSFTDKLNDSQSTVIYYRLYSVDNNGKSQYAGTSVVKTSK